MEKQYAFGKYKCKTIKKIENNIMSLSQQQHLSSVEIDISTHFMHYNAGTCVK